MRASVVLALVVSLGGAFGPARQEPAPDLTAAAPATDQLPASVDCPGGLVQLGADQCTHGDDPAPPGLDPSQKVPPISAAAADSTADVACSGSTGKRVQVVYARYEGTPDNYSVYLASFRAWAAGVDAIFQESAAETGSVRRPLFVTDSSCRVTVVRQAIPLPIGNVTNKLREQGLDRSDRKYLIFLDHDGVCGTAGVPQDERPGIENQANQGPSHAIVGNGCWGPETAAHELLHTLGGVHNSAPHATGHSHCRDEYDRMCYRDGDNVTLLHWCPNAHDRLFDCNHNDYFHTRPAPDSYLGTHWNTANSVFLSKASQSTWAYVHANRPTTPSYTPRAARSFNSSGATNTVTRTGTGAYTVHFPGMSTGVLPHVTAYGSSPRHCTVRSWGPGFPLSDQLVDVRCFTPSGAPADSQFTASLVHPRNYFGAFAHLLANQPSTPEYNPSPFFSYNSTTTTPAANRIQRAGAGVYLVWLPGLGPAAEGDSVGTAIVTAAGTTSGWCRASGWGRQGQDVLAVVHCRDASGALADTTFTFTYANQLSLLGLNGGRAAYVLADQETAPSYTPDLRHQYNSAGEANTIERTGTGAYTVWLPGLKDFAASGEGNVQISIEDQARDRCQVLGWSPYGDDIRISVRCFTYTGQPADTEFTLTFSS